LREPIADLAFRFRFFLEGSPVRIIRRSLLLAVLALVALPFTAVGSSAQEAPDLSITVRKVVSGTGAPSAVSVDCLGNPVEALNFDAQGNPVASGADTDWAIEGGAWVLEGGAGEGGECTFTETATGGASSTAWTCAYTFVPPSGGTATVIQQAGCQAAAGSGVGPATVLYPGSGEVEEQASTVVFTNTFGSAPPDAPIQPAAQVVAQPAFTG
jgi:hypothetical protein